MLELFYEEKQYAFKIKYMSKNQVYVLFSEYMTFLQLNHWVDKKAFYIKHLKKMFLIH